MYSLLWPAALEPPPPPNTKMKYELSVDFYFIRITGVTDKMISVLQNTVMTLAQQRRRGGSSRRRKQHPRSVPGGGRGGTGGGKDTEPPKFVTHDLGSNDNRFLDTVVESVKDSVENALNLRVERYC